MAETNNQPEIEALIQICELLPRLTAPERNYLIDRLRAENLREFKERHGLLLQAAEDKQEAHP